MEQFFMRFSAILAGAILIGVVGCSPKPGDQRPAADQLPAGNAPRRAKDIASAINQMAGDLLAVRELNAAGHPPTIAIADVNNRTIDPDFTYETFSRGLAAGLSRGGVILIENRAGQNPDFRLSITVDELPNLATSYYQIIATLTNLHTRERVWVSPPYDVQANR
jgi:hypothetical protein